MSRMIVRIRSTIGLVSLILIAACASIEAKTVGRPMSGDEIRTLNVGGTIQGPLGRKMYDWYYQAPFELTAKLDKLTVELEPPKLAPGDGKKPRDARAKAKAG